MILDDAEPAPGEGGRLSGYPVLGLGCMGLGRVGESRSGAPPKGPGVALTYGHRTGRCADLAQTVLAVPRFDEAG